MVCQFGSLRLAIVFVSLIITLSYQANGYAQIADAKVEDLITQLQDSDLDRRRNAAYELASRQLGSEDVVRAFAKAVSDDDTQVRFQALLGLARVASSASPAIPELIKCLDHRDDQVRFRAADALGKIGSPALQPLLDAWDNGSERIRIAAAQAMTAMGPAAESARDRLTDALEDAPETLARHISQALVSLAPNDQQQLLRLADHPEPSVRCIGITALANIQDPSAAATLALKEAVQDSEPLIRETAVIAMSKAEFKSEEKAEFIEAALLDSSAAVRAAANVAMRKANLTNQKFAKRLAARLPNANPETRNAIIAALENIGSNAAGTFPLLVDMFPPSSNPQHTDVDESQLVSTIASFGGLVVADLLETIETRPELEPLLSRSLAAIGTPAMPALVRGMDSESELIRLASTRALSAMDNLDADVIVRLANATTDDSADIRAIAVSASIRRNVGNPEVKASLLTATKDPDAVVRAAAIPALAQLDFQQAEIETALRAALADEDATVRTSGLNTLAQLSQLLESFSDQVLALSQDQSSLVRTAAANTISNFDSNQRGNSVIDALVRLLADDELSVKVAATKAVEQLELAADPILQAMTVNLKDDSDVNLMLASLEVATSLGEGANLLAPSVVKLLDHQQASVRMTAAGAVAAVEKDAGKKTEWLSEMLDDSELEVRRIAAVQLGKLGPSAKAAVPKLFQLLNSEADSDFASGALREIDAAPVEALDLLIENLDSEERRVGFYAVTLLGKIGPPAKAALPKLEAMLDDSGQSGRGNRSDFRRRFLREAIEKIKGE